jgi:hypothetical protein
MGKEREISVGIGIIIFLLLVILAISLWLKIDRLPDPHEFSAILDFIAILTFFVGFFGVLAIYKELNETGGFNEAQLMVNLYRDFSQNKEVQKIYKELRRSSKRGKDYHIDDENIDQIINYLTFFETLNYLETKKIIDIKTVNDLYGSRFFLAAHNKDVQQSELFQNNPESNKNIFILHRKLVKYQNENNIQQQYKLYPLKEQYEIFRKNVNPKLKSYQELSEAEHDIWYRIWHWLRRENPQALQENKDPQALQEKSEAEHDIWDRACQPLREKRLQEEREKEHKIWDRACQALQKK